MAYHHGNNSYAFSYVYCLVHSFCLWLNNKCLNHANRMCRNTISSSLKHENAYKKAENLFVLHLLRNI